MKADFLKCRVSENEYEYLRTVQVGNQSMFSEQKKGQSKSLYLKGELIAFTSPEGSVDFGGITGNQFGFFLGRFNKQLFKRFQVNPSLFDLKLDFDGYVRDRSMNKWDQIPVGSYFYHLDIKSAYWQIAYKLGYLNKKMYDRYFWDDDYKAAKRLCISFLARTAKMEYVNPVDNSSFEIKCETEILNQVYENIRHGVYLAIQKACAAIENDFIEFNVDAITVLNYNVGAVKNAFIEQGLMYKLTQCKKLSSTEYMYGSKKKNFIQQLQKINEYE